MNVYLNKRYWSGGTFIFDDWGHDYLINDGEYTQKFKEELPYYTHVYFTYKQIHHGNYYKMLLMLPHFLIYMFRIIIMHILNILTLGGIDYIYIFLKSALFSKIFEKSTLFLWHCYTECRNMIFSINHLVCLCWSIGDFFNKNNAIKRYLDFEESDYSDSYLDDFMYILNPYFYSIFFIQKNYILKQNYYSNNLFLLIECIILHILVILFDKIYYKNAIIFANIIVRCKYSLFHNILNIGGLMKMIISVVFMEIVPKLSNLLIESFITLSNLIFTFILIFFDYLFISILKSLKKMKWALFFLMILILCDPLLLLKFIIDFISLFMNHYWPSSKFVNTSTILPSLIDNNLYFSDLLAYTNIRASEFQHYNTIRYQSGGLYFREQKYISHLKAFNFDEVLFPKPVCHNMIYYNNIWKEKLPLSFSFQWEKEKTNEYIQNSICFIFPQKVKEAKEYVKSPFTYQKFWRFYSSVNLLGGRGRPVVDINENKKFEYKDFGVHLIKIRWKKSILDNLDFFKAPYVGNFSLNAQMHHVLRSSLLKYFVLSNSYNPRYKLINYVLGPYKGYNINNMSLLPWFIKI